jgi:hypothetical protein
MSIILLVLIVFMMNITIIYSSKINYNNKKTLRGDSHGVLYNIIKRGLTAILPEDSFHKGILSCENLILIFNLIFKIKYYIYV